MYPSRVLLIAQCSPDTGLRLEATADSRRARRYGTSAYAGGLVIVILLLAHTVLALRSMEITMSPSFATTVGAM
jgi:hypothetical protein